MKMKSVGVLLFIFVLLEVICCQACLKQEREALLLLNSRFAHPMSWVDGTDCCHWEGVECNTTTGRVAELNLFGMREHAHGHWYLNYSNFIVFKDLKSLNLSLNGIAGCEENEGLQNLEVLDLSANKLEDAASILSCLDGLSSLKSLYLSENRYNATSLIHGLSALTKLKILDLGFNQISNFFIHQGSKTIRRLDVLVLDGNKINGNKLRKSLQAFSSIRVLSLRHNEFKGTIVASDFGDLSNLEHLTLDDSSNLEKEFFKSIGELTSLKVLSMVECEINGSLPAADWSKLKQLEELDLSYNKFEGPLPSSFVNMTSLRKLELSHNQFSRNFDSNIASLSSLEYFGFQENQFDVPVSFTPFANHSNLKFIYGEGNRVILDSQASLPTWIPKFQLQVLSLSSTTESKSLPLPSFLLYQYNLTSLDFTSCKLEGEFPNWLLENNTKMTKLLVRNCSFTGTFQLPSRPLLNFWRLDVSENVITGRIPGKNISSIFPNLQSLNMSMNKIQGSIPGELGQMNLLIVLDLSENYLSGEIPKNISGVRSQLVFLELSNNMLDGPMFPTLTTLKYLRLLYLDGNNLSGSIPSSLFNTSLAILNISSNHLAGKLPSVVGNYSNLMFLSLPNNHLEGSIPKEFGELESLAYLDISQNNFTGLIPSFANSPVAYIYLSNNRFSGFSKRMFKKSSSYYSLRILDFRYNEIPTSINYLIKELSNTSLKILLLKGNHFSGQIPKQICQLMTLTILDLSYNNISGPIPSCLGKIPFQNEGSLDMEVGILHYNDYINDPLSDIREQADFTTKTISYTYTGEILGYMSGIDLSYNKLTGSIPSKLGNLTKIRALNLSYNYLTGKIPATFSSLVQIESLDLSFNRLSSKIPPQLNELNSLEVFSVAHNNLSGATPKRKGQFITFDESSYEGNPFLCGPPLPKSCNAQPPATLPNGSYIDGDNDSSIDMYVFYVSFVVSYTSALLAVAATLYINPYWRQAWFYYIELITTNCYYFIEDNLCKFSNIRNM